MRASRHPGILESARVGCVVVLVGLTGGCAGQFNALRNDILPCVWEQGVLGLLQPEEGRSPDGLGKRIHTAQRHNRAGLVRLQDGHYFEAVQHFEVAIKLAPRWAEPRENLGRLYEEIGQVDRAIALYESALALEPGRRSTMQRLARAYVKAGRRDSRTRMVLAKVAADPHGGRWNEWAQTRLAWIDRS